MAVVLHLYKEVEIVNAELLEGTLKEPPVVTISCDEKPGIQALATTSPDLPPVPNKHRSHLRDGEYVRLGTVSLLAGLDLHTGRVTEIVSDRHASADFIRLLGKLDEGYPPEIRIRLLLDNHSAHISKETQGWLSLHPQRFEFVFTPKHGSWLNIVETMFSKMARSMLRYSRCLQTGTCRPHPFVLQADQRRPRDLPMEIQNGGNRYCIDINRTLI